MSGGSTWQMLRKFGAFRYSLYLLYWYKVTNTDVAVWFGFSETMVGNFAAQIVDGLDYLHSQVLS